MPTVSVTQTLDASPEAVWSIIAAGDRVDRWLPAVTACRLEGSGPGARRVCIVGGAELEERIDTVDPSARLFQYRITRQSMMPIRDIVGTFHVAALGPRKTHVLWSLRFELDDPAHLDAIRNGITDLYRAGLAGLATYAAAGGGA
ncbi:MAG: SRPBCC family protein [Chloroflexi bacterium]|nr:SRPBCC family protein [Chloroflexota bacterium]